MGLRYEFRSLNSIFSIKILLYRKDKWGIYRFVGYILFRFVIYWISMWINVVSILFLLSDVVIVR